MFYSCSHCNKFYSDSEVDVDIISNKPIEMELVCPDCGMIVQEFTDKQPDDPLGKLEKSTAEIDARFVKLVESLSDYLVDVKRRLERIESKLDKVQK